MNFLYMLERTDKHYEYDIYVGFIVCAEDDNEAKQITATRFGECQRIDQDGISYNKWPLEMEFINAIYLGVADPVIKKGILFNSYWAG